MTEDVSALTARIRAAQQSTPKTPEEAGEALTEALAGPGLIVCCTRCWACQFDQHMDPPKAHPWADAEDVAHAKQTGQPEPTGNCACRCAKEASE